MKSDSAILIIVHGKVQGVFFRAGTESLAKKLGLVGFVRNLDNGSVEIFAEGRRETLQKLLEWCYAGPKNAEVSEVEFSWQEPNGNFAEFRIEYN